MTVNLADKINLLKREYLFQGMTQEQLIWLAARFEAREYERDTTIFLQGSPSDYFYYVFDGKVQLLRKERGEEKFLTVLTTGDFFGETGLLFNKTRTETARTIETTTLLRMNKANFQLMLETYPGVGENLTATAESRRLARTQRFAWLGDDEVIYYITRKHWLILVLALLPAALFMIASIPLLVLVLSGSPTPFFFWLGVGAGLFMLLGGFAWAIWSWVDWGNDFYIVTSQRVTWSEKVVGLYESRQEAPMSQVLAVNVTSSQLGRIFRYGNVNVKTYTGGILMRNANHPYRFASFVEGFKERAIQLTREQEAREMEAALESALTMSMIELEDEILAVAEEPAPVPVQPGTRGKKGKEPEKRVSLQRRIDNILKVRYEEGGTITYRKHWFILLMKIWLPLTLLILLAVGLVAVVSANLFGGFFVASNLVIMTLAFLLGMIFSVWLWYDLVDWANDIYQLTPEQILDIERKPLGEEMRKTAPLESILSIEHRRDNILGILLNFGTVTVNVGQTKFVFHGVFNPDQVHSDVSNYQEALTQRKRKQEQARERDRMVEWLVAFYHSSEKLEERESEPEAFHEPEDRPEWEDFSG